MTEESVKKIFNNMAEGILGYDIDDVDMCFLIDPHDADINIAKYFFGTMQLLPRECPFYPNEVKIAAEDETTYVALNTYVIRIQENLSNLKDDDFNAFTWHFDQVLKIVALLYAQKIERYNLQQQIDDESVCFFVESFQRKKAKKE